MSRFPTICLLLFCFATPAGAVRWTDAVGRVVEVPESPRRIVSLVPSITEILFALGLGDRVVGVTSFCTYPPEAVAKPKIGGYSDPSIEAVVAQNPDLIFVSADACSPSLVARFEALGIPTYTAYPRGLEEAVATMRAIGRVSGVPDAGEQAARSLALVIDGIKSATAGRPRPRVLLCVMVRPLTVAGPKTLGHDLIEVAGGENVVPGGAGRYPTWGPESVLAADPDVIIVSPHPGDPDPALYFADWLELRAVRAKRILTIEPDWIHRPGPRLALGLAALARAFHEIELSTEALPCPE